jgi:hypothetical protein
MAANESLGSKMELNPARDIGRCDYVKSEFELNMYQVKAQLYAAGVDMLASRGEVSPLYFGTLGASRFEISESRVQGQVDVKIDDEMFTAPMNTVVERITGVLQA